MKVVAQFEGHEVNADGVMSEIIHAFGDSGILLALFDDAQLRDLLSKFGTAPSNLRDSNRLELLYLLSNRVTSERSEAALIVGHYITQHFGVDDDDDNLSILCEELLDYASLDSDEEDDDEEDQVNCEQCGDEFDPVGRCSCATSYDFDEDHKEEQPVIKAKEGSQVLDVNYANFLAGVADQDLLKLIPAIVTSRGDNTFSLHTAEEVRLWLQQAKSMELRTVLRYVREPNEGHATDVVQSLDSVPRSEQHLIVINMLEDIGVEIAYAEEDDAIDERPDNTYNKFIAGLRNDVLMQVMVSIDNYTDDAFGLTHAHDVRVWLQQATHEELMGVWNRQVEDGAAENDDYIEQNREFFSERYEVLLNILSAATGDPSFSTHDDEDEDAAEDETYALRS